MLVPKLSGDDYSLVIRTDFSDDSAWEVICDEIEQPQTEDNFSASVEFLSEKACDGLEPEAVRALLPRDYYLSCAFLVDAATVASKEHPVLVVDYLSKPARSFRVIPSEAWSIENNLRLANMDFEAFLSECGEDGVFRGFPE